MPVSRKLANEYMLVQIKFSYNLNNYNLSYIVFLYFSLHGDDPVEICRYNAQVAADNNRPDLEQVWLLASLILSQTVSIKRLKNSLTSDDIIPIERILGFYPKCTSKRRESRSAYDSFIDDAFREFFGRLNWGFHPFGKGLVKDLYVKRNFF